MKQVILNTFTGDQIYIETVPEDLCMSVNGAATRYESRSALRLAYLELMRPLVEENEEYDGECYVSIDNSPITLTDPLGEDTHLMLDADPIVVRTTPIGEGDEPAGVSRVGGHPDLPDSVSWPVGMTFAFQINFKELHGMQEAEALPEEGILWCFVADEIERSVVLYSSDTKGLAPREAPKDDSPREAERIYEHELSPRRINFASTDEPELATSGFHLLGEPADLNETGGDVFARVEREQDEDGFARYSGPYQLIVQFPIAQGYLYVGMPAEDLERADFGRAVVAYGGT